MNNNLQHNNQSLYNSIARIVVEAKATVYRSANTILLKMYWEIGQLIIEDEQKGASRAEYGKAVLKNLADQLTLDFGKGFDERNLNNMRAFFLAFPIWNAVRSELSWTHYRIISRLDNQQLRQQYISHSIEGNWNTRTLQRNIDSQYLGRLLQLPDNEEPAETNHFIKDPYIFEFLGLPTDTRHTETKMRKLDLRPALVSFTGIIADKLHSCSACFLLYLHCYLPTFSINATNYFWHHYRFKKV